MITGSIRSVDIPQVEAGQTLKATVDYVASNPGALYWKTWLIGISYQLNLKKILDETREIGTDGGRVKTFTLGTQPDRTAAISFFLFASDSASASWNWATFDAWMQYGYALPAGVVYLGSSYEFADPATPALPDPEFRNLVVQSVTSPVKTGDSCLVSCRWEYRGPAIYKTLYAAIGNSGWAGFDEILSSTSERSIPESASWRTMYGSVIIPITVALDPADGPYDVYAKLTGVGNDPVSPTRENILAMSGPVIPDPEYRGLIITGYDAGVEPGGYCNVQVRFQYRGPAGVKTLHAAIGNTGWAGFDEILNASEVLSIPESVDWRDINASVAVFIGTGIDPAQSPYDLYTKLSGTGNDIVSPTLENIITVIGQDPVPDAEFRNLSITNHTAQVAQGGHCSIDVRFEYRGPTITKTLYAAIGNSGIFGFDEIVHSSRVISINRADDWDYVTATIEVPITESLDPDQSPYDLYAKLTGASNDISSPVLNNVVTVQGGGYPNPEFQSLQVIDVSSPVQIGGTCWVKIKFQYRGPELSKDLYVAIGNSGIFGFNEIIHSSGVMNLPASENWQPVESDLAIEITDAIDPADSPYDVYAKITGPGNDLISPSVIDALVIEPGTGTGDITGSITAIEPLVFNVTDPVDIFVSFKAYCDDAVLQVTGWDTRVTVQLDGMSESVEHNHVGREGSVDMQKIPLGPMPDKKLSGKVTLEGRGEGDWTQLYVKAITVNPPGAGPGEEGTPGLAWLLAGSLLLLAAVSGKKSPAKKRTETKR